VIDYRILTAAGRKQVWLSREERAIIRLAVATVPGALARNLCDRFDLIEGDEGG